MVDRVVHIRQVAGSNPAAATSLKGGGSKMVRTNIKKMGKKKASTEFDRIYEEAGLLLKKHNPCQFVGNKCLHNRREKERKAGWNSENGCCSTDCKYHTPKGCDTKALGCKLTTCGHMYNRSSEEFRSAINNLKNEAVEIFGWEVTTAYTNKEDFLKGEIKH